MTDDEASTPERDAAEAAHPAPEPTAFDPRNPGDEFLQREIDANRRSERVLVLRAAIAIAVVAFFVVVREIFLRLT